MSTADVIQKALELSESERFRVLEAIMESFPADSDLPDDEMEFAAELKRRSDEALSDPSSCSSADEVYRRMRAEIDEMKETP